NHLARNKVSLDPDILETFVMGIDGKILASSNKQHIRLMRDDADYFIGAKEQDVYVTDLHQCVDSGEPVMEVSRLLSSRINGELKSIGVIVNRIKGTSLANLIVKNLPDKKKEISPGSHLMTYIINSSNHVIAGSSVRHDEMLRMIMDTKPVILFNDSGKEIIDVYQDHMGNQVFGVSMYDEKMDWLIVVEEDVNTVFADMKYLRNYAITMKIITICIVMFLAIYISRGLTLPIKSLLEGTKKLAEGMLEYRIKISTRDEIGELANSFNTMADAVQERTSTLNNTKDYLKSILDNTQDMVITTDKKGRIVEFNTGAEEILGYSRLEIVGSSAEIFYLDINKKNKLLKRLESEGSVKNYETKFRTKQGKDIYMVITISQLKDNSGSVIGIVEVGKDITDKKRWEESLKETNKKLELEITERKIIEMELYAAKEVAEEANKTKSAFLAHMSHEIRTPMNGVMGMAELLQDTELTQEQHDYLDTICDSADSLLTIINDILDFSKMEAGKMEIEKINFDLDVMMEGIIDIFAVKIENKGLRFSCFIDPEVPSLFIGDPGRLRQVLINLVNNAIKFTNDGEVAIDVSLIKETESHDTLRFVVRDTGIGIPSDRVNLLFNSFSQVDVSTTRKYGGTGLGLAISKQITELMGGQIGVESNKCGGSSFWFMVELEKPHSGKQQTPFKLGDIEHTRVMIIDEDNKSRLILRAYLESWQCRVEEVNSTDEAIRRLKVAVNDGDAFKIVLLDNFMSKLDIGELGRRIKEDLQLKDMHLVAMTPVGRRGDAKHFQILGFDAYLVKPIKRSILYDCLRIVTGKTVKVVKNTSKNIITQYTIAEDHKKRANILVVDDNLVNQKIALHLLDKKLGYNADVVSNGREALDALKKLDYDLVLMDCHMPEMDGYEATCNIRDDRSTVRNHNIPIIAMTANAMNGDREKCIEAGMNDYVTKPINVKKLASAIERHMQGDTGHKHPHTTISMAQEIDAEK
ncbi:MAG: response regulator, partial [Planctomycetota bacterium]